MTFFDILLPPPGLSIPDALAALCWFLATAVLGVAAWSWARYLSPQDHLLETVSHTIVFCWTGIVAVATALGAAGWLSGTTLLGGVATVSLAALVWRWRLESTAPAPLQTDQAERCWLLVWGALLALWVGQVVIGGILKYPEDWDSLAYHIPLVDHWLHAHSLYAPSCGRWANPGNNELLALWAVAPFSGDYLVSLNNLPVAVLFATSAVSLGLRLGFAPPLAHLCGLALVCNHVVLKQLVDAENDVAVAAGFFAALLYAFRYATKPADDSLLLGSLCLGLLAGVKYYALGYAALALAAWVLLAATAHGPSRSLRVLLAGGAGCLALGGYWYFRNTLATGSPLYPREFFKHPDLVALMYPGIAQSSFFGNNRPELLGLYLQAIWKMTGPWQVSGFVLLPVSLIWLIGSGVRHALHPEEALEARKRLALAGILAGTGILLGITPFAVEDDPGTLNQMYWYYCPVRYGLCFLSTSTLAAAFLLGDAVACLQGARKEKSVAALDPQPRCAPRALTHLLYFLLGCSILYQLARCDTNSVTEKIDSLLIASNLVIDAVVLVLLGGTTPIRRRFLLIATLAVAVPTWVWVCSTLADRWHQGFAAHYDRTFPPGGFSSLAEEAAFGSTVCVLDHRSYPYFGSRRQFRIYQPVYTHSSQWLMDQFMKEDVRFVVACLGMRSTSRSSFQGFDDCLARHPEMFQRLTSQSGFVLFRVDREVPVPKAGTP